MKESESADISNEIVTYDLDDTTCSLCYAEFLDSEDLELHIQQVHPSLPSGTLVNCQFCDKCFPDAETYVVHIRNDHLLNFKSCSACYRIFTSNAQLKKHEIKHPLSMHEGTYACSQCNQYFMYKSELIAHELSSHYESDEGVFLNKHFALLSSVINIKAETFIKSVGNDKKDWKEFIYICTCCKHKNSDLENYILHLKRTNCRSFACDKCFRVYNKKGCLFVHSHRQPNCSKVKAKRSKKKDVKLKQCSKCKSYFDSKSIKNHNCSSSLKCPNCVVVFDNMYELSEHQSKVHPLAVALVMCKFCRKECVGAEALEKHVQKSHEHELHLYKYTCSYCDTTFKHPQRLFAHYFLKHKDIEPYLCKICNKKFRIRKSFTLHIKLEHKSEGFVEFDEKLHVFFTDKKSAKPFQPISKYVRENPTEDDKNNSDDNEINEDSSKSDKVDKENDTASKTKNPQATNIDPDEPDATEENKNDGTVTACRKRKINDDVDQVLALSDYDSDDEPLLLVKKKAKLKARLRRKPLKYKKKKIKNAKKPFTCEICKKYCYTFQNYQNHVSLHFRDESKKCIKCPLSFKTKADLEQHMTDKHSSSQLTETLKSILERRKKGEQKQEMSASAKFLNTIKKVHIEKDNITATISPITDKELSVKNFIENFTPEIGEGKNADTVPSVTITKVTNPVSKKPVIKMTKFKPAPEMESHVKLAMPVRFKKCNEIHSVSVRRVLTRTEPTEDHYTYDDGNQYEDDDNDYNYNDDTKDANIPEVEQEVTLEGTEDVPKVNPASHKIVIPKLPKELKTIRIAHLLPDAPYYKIVKMDDIIKKHQEKEQLAKNDDKEVQKQVTLPDGTKLVHVNPLAHLLGDRPIEQILKSSNKYYKPKSRNFEEVLANALRKLENPNRQVKKKKEQNKDKEETIVPNKVKNVKEINSSDNNVINNDTNDDEMDKNVTEDATTEEKATSDVVEVE